MIRHAIKQERKRWSPEQDERLLLALASGRTYAAVGVEIGVTARAITARMEALRRKGEPRAFTRKPPTYAGIELPTDFVERAVVETVSVLCARYDVSKATISKWRKQTGARRPASAAAKPKSLPRPIPDSFTSLAPTMRRYDAAIYYGVGAHTIDRWALKTGVRLKHIKTHAVRGQTVTVDHNAARDMSRAGQAAHFLRRFGPVSRCDVTGSAEGKPTHWRRGSFVLTDAEIVDRAVRNGWQPDAWQKLAA